MAQQAPAIEFHTVTLVGYDDAHRAFKFINSWGAGRGANGLGFIDYDLFPRVVREAYLVTPRGRVKAPLRQPRRRRPRAAWPSPRWTPARTVRPSWSRYAIRCGGSLITPGKLPRISCAPTVVFVSAERINRHDTPRRQTEHRRWSAVHLVSAQTIGESIDDCPTRFVTLNSVRIGLSEGRYAALPKARRSPWPASLPIARVPQPSFTNRRPTTSRRTIRRPPTSTTTCSWTEPCPLRFERGPKGVLETLRCRLR